MNFCRFARGFIGNEPAARVERDTDPEGLRRAMSMQALMSAAHAAGYAMAAEDLAEPRPESLRREGTAVAVRPPRPALSELLTAQRLLRWLWLRDWFAGHWPGRATA
jgi:hypothetical protein